MQRCAQCRGKLGLGVRSRNLWNGRWWIHVRFCSTHCEALHELERYDAKSERRRLTPPTSLPSAEVATCLPLKTPPPK
jgi:hypothetical protein